ncbi:MAG TPA: cupredoxin domain-containing protein [Gemmatimonadales bacterium]|nr:cupredoxin domain-containing protein [Gemmatimonadales bacterium]
MGRPRRAGFAGSILPFVLCTACGAPAPRSAAYRPRVRPVTVTAVPLLTREMQRVYPFLARDFGAGGVLEGKEVYAFEPSTVTAVEGDTLALTLVNPEDDAHSFVLGDLAVAMPPQQAVTARYVAGRAGIFPFTCSVPTHLPFMYGTLVVLSPSQLGPE